MHLLLSLSPVALSPVELYDLLSNRDCICILKQGLYLPNPTKQWTTSLCPTPS